MKWEPSNIFLAINEIAQKSREHNRVEAQWINDQEDVDEVGAKQDARAKAPRGFFNGLQPQQSSRQMMEDHGDKPFGVMERLTREKEEAARKLREEQDQREKEEEERRMKEMLCKQNEGPGSASSSRQRIRAILEKQKKQREEDAKMQQQKSESQDDVAKFLWVYGGKPAMF